MTKRNPEQRERDAREAVGKVIEAVEYDEEDDYYVMVFTDGTEMAFRFMADLA